MAGMMLLEFLMISFQLKFWEIVILDFQKHGFTGIL